MKVKRIWPVVFGCCLLLVGAGLGRAGQATPSAAVAYFPEKKYIFDPVVEGTEIIHDFSLQNKGSEKLLVQKITTD